jgi:3-dehydroquinate dehydratase-1
MERPSICATIVGKDLEEIKKVTPIVDFFEVRIDLIGGDWRKIVKKLKKPWIACNRHPNEGGKWKGSEDKRVAELLDAVEYGADIIDIELRTRNLKYIVSLIKNRAKCLLSFHDMVGSSTLDQMKAIVQKEISAGADIAKLVTTALNFKDNLTVLQLISEFPQARIISFAMGPLGLISRVLCPLVGGYCTYASMAIGKNSAPGQLTAEDLRVIYTLIAAKKRARI